LACAIAVCAVSAITYSNQQCAGKAHRKKKRPITWLRSPALSQFCDRERSFATVVHCFSYNGLSSLFREHL